VVVHRAVRQHQLEALSAPLLAAALELPQPAGEAQVADFVDRETHADRIGERDEVQDDRIRVLPHELADLRLRDPDATADGRVDLRVAELDPGLLDSRGGCLHGAPRGLVLRDGAIQVLLADRVHLRERTDAIEVGPGLREPGARLGQVALGLDHLRLEGARVDGVEQVALGDLTALGEVHAEQHPLDPRPDRDVGGPERLPHHLEHDRLVALDHGHDRHLRHGRRGRLARTTGSHERERGHSEPGDPEGAQARSPARRRMGHGTILATARTRPGAPA
jgi:hypothetical protein